MPEPKTPVDVVWGWFDVDGRGTHAADALAMHRTLYFLDRFRRARLTGNRRLDPWQGVGVSVADGGAVRVEWAKDRKTYALTLRPDAGMEVRRRYPGGWTAETVAVLGKTMQKSLFNVWEMEFLDELLRQ
jgi:hypothetical protein